MSDLKYTPPPLRPASTVIIVREKHKALEVYLLRRSTQSGFMGGLYVFPGGGVEPDDQGVHEWAPHIDLTLDQVENHLGGNGFPLEDALGFGVAAIRETLEEAGVLMASPRGKTPEDFSEVSAHRLNKDLPGSWFRNRMMDENWTLAFSHLGRWSHWITPERMKKRFDTRFFIVFMPQDQTCATDDWETKEGIWLTPPKALEENLQGTIPLSPPTVVTLTQLSGFTLVDALKNEIKTRPWGDPIAPCLVSSTCGPVILEPWDPQWQSPGDINLSTLSEKVLPPGAPFSRIWCDNGVWKPVGL